MSGRESWDPSPFAQGSMYFYFLVITLFVQYTFVPSITPYCTESAEGARSGFVMTSPDSGNPSWFTQTIHRPLSFATYA
jgi:hypothetical protein